MSHNLFNSQEPMDENCYEQMKARPEKSVNERHEATPSAQVSFVFCFHICTFQEHKSSTL